MYCYRRTFITGITKMCKAPTGINLPLLTLSPSSSADDATFWWWWVGVLALFVECLLLGFQSGGGERRLRVSRGRGIKPPSTEPSGTWGCIANKVGSNTERLEVNWAKEADEGDQAAPNKVQVKK